MIESYLKDSPEVRAVVVLLDSRREPDDRDQRLVEWLQHYGIPAIYALTKADKLKRQEAERARQEIAAKLGIEGPLLLTSATKGTGISELRAEVSNKLNAK
jgi:GTP-binding protein